MPVLASSTADRRRRARGRRTTDLPPWATVALALIATAETLSLAMIAALLVTT